MCLYIQIILGETSIRYCGFQERWNQPENCLLHSKFGSIKRFRGISCGNPSRVVSSHTDQMITDDSRSDIYASRVLVESLDEDLEDQKYRGV